MATHALPAPHILDDDAPATAAHTRKPALLRRLYRAMLRSQMRRAGREIDRIRRDRAPLHR